MASAGGNVASTFRQKFHAVPKDVLRWFPGHMHKGLKQMEQRLKNVDCLIEVHDARTPISGRFTETRHTLTGLKPHILVLNKVDLADVSYKKIIIPRLKGEGFSNIIFTNFKSERCMGMKQILPTAKQLIASSDRFNRSEERSYALMVIGVPNVGKSSLINRLRNTYMGKRKAAPEGGVAGITRSVQCHIKVSEDPNVYLIDTPGILTPTVTNVNAGLKLALVGCLQDHLVGEETLADFLLFWLNANKRFKYVTELGLHEPSDDILYVLTFIAAKYKKTLQIKGFDNKKICKPNLKYAADLFLYMFRKGQFGPVCLDRDLL